MNATNNHVSPDRAAPRLAASLETLRSVQTPRSTRWLARLLVLTFVVSPVLLFLLPWTQSFHATGRVVAFDPTERQQDIEAPVDGRIKKWKVKEGDKVTKDQLLVQIEDPDPLLISRLTQQKTAILERATAARDRKTSFAKQITSLESSQKQAIAAGKSRLAMGKERLEAAKEALRVAAARLKIDRENYSMERQLVDDGLTSRLTFVTAEQRQEQSVAEERRAMNTRDAAVAEVEALKADLEKINNDADAAIASAAASKQAAEAELASANRDLTELDIRIARQGTQDVVSPCEGTIFRILANSDRGGALVKSGERLAVFTPDIDDPQSRTVELFLDGNDAPQLMELWRQRGEETPIHVRIQFEGWPAIQFVGWPSLAWGTFGGRVKLVDPHDDGKGRFRILVEADGEVWPRGYSLRQGTRAQGWVMLDNVSLGYELWRRFNGFPPVVSGKDDEELKIKPGKVKVPK